MDSTKRNNNDAKSPIEETVENMLRIRYLVILGALLPGAGCYFVVAFTYIFQFENVANFREANGCKNLSITLPPISYSIGIWSPQKFIWMIVMFIHMPPRLFFITLYRRLFLNMAPKNRFYKFIVDVYMITLRLEPLGLILVSVVDIDSEFLIHALGFAIWIITFNLNMFFNIILHHFGDIRNIHKTYEMSWRIKFGIFIIGLIAALSTPVTYGLFASKCSDTAYNLFSLGELIEVGCNSLFYAIAYIDFPKTRVTIGIKSVECEMDKMSKPTTIKVGSSLPVKEHLNI